MRALTIQQPWAWAIAKGFKTIENRSWRPRLIEPGDVFAVHAAAAAPDAEDIEWLTGQVGRRGKVPDWFDCSCVVALVRFVGTTESSRSPWFSGPIGWELADAQRLRDPVECTGRLGLWELPARVEGRVLKQVVSRRRARGVGKRRLKGAAARGGR